MNLLQYGLQRSGTNFLETILKKNYQIQFLNSNQDRRSPLQKHFRLYDAKDIVPGPQYQNDILIEDFAHFEHLFPTLPDYYLIISKDPYSWYLSYMSWANKCNWPNVNHHYIEEYNFFYGKFLEFSSQTDKLIFIRYIDLIKDVNKTLNQLELRTHFRKKLFARLTLRQPNKVSHSSHFTEDKRAYYTNKKYLAEYAEDELQTLNNLLDSHVISLLGYEKITAIK
ncbi:MAG: hypothetical protein F6K42_12190 [Leptolyngbya sp. SIO1D8]|nr:hypothetical protein [Leptolyngbya sp. SIO1D8]